VRTHEDFLWCYTCAKPGSLSAKVSPCIGYTNEDFRKALDAANITPRRQRTLKMCSPDAMTLQPGRSHMSRLVLRAAPLPFHQPCRMPAPVSEAILLLPGRLSRPRTRRTSCLKYFIDHAFGHFGIRSGKWGSVEWGQTLDVEHEFPASDDEHPSKGE
jgi:hypothetical protein